MKSRITIEIENLTYEELIDIFAEIIAETTTNLSEYTDFDLTIDCVRREE